MKMQDDIETFVPQAPKHHAVFGNNYIKNHFFIDSKWTPTGRIAEYRCMVDILEKRKAFNNAQGIGNRRKQNKLLQRLKKQVIEGRNKVKTALHGNSQDIRNILQNHKELLRLYQNMPMHLIADNINQRTFVKRKENDRLNHKKNQMTKKYAASLLELSRLQDRVKYQNEFVMTEEIMAKESRMNLKNSETRLRALKTIARAYTSIRNALYQDAIYYGPVLNSLQNDINEQASFIRQVIHIGRPALGTVGKLVKEYDILEEQIRKAMLDRLATLTQSRQKNTTNSGDMKKLVRKDSDFEIFPHRYDRETPSMVNLKKNLEDVEHIMKKVKQVTLCAHAREVYPRMKKQIRDDLQVQNKLKSTQIEKNFLMEKDARAEVLIEQLKYDVTDESNERKERIKELTRQLDEEKESQKVVINHMKERGEIMCYLRFSIYQLVNVMRHVSEPMGIARREYPNPDLKLPLLNFATFPPKAYPPGAFEANPEKLLQGIKDRTKLLMNAYKQKKTDQDLNEASKDYHRAYMRSLLVTTDAEEKSMEAAPLLEEEERGDPTVPTRKQIKAMSEKIVEERSKMDD